MGKIIVGHTGFVGGNLTRQTDFSGTFNSKNIEDIVGTRSDVLVCAGIPASMWMANNYPDKDLEQIESLLKLLSQARTEHFVLISSIAVYLQPVDGFDETTITFETDKAYGKNRRFAEEYVLEHFENATVIRLPALFGDGLKKNFLYDLLNQEPAFMPEAAFEQFCSRLSNSENSLVRRYYQHDSKKQIWVFDKDTASKDDARKQIVAVLRKYNRTSLQFTDSRSQFQWYYLDHLWSDIQRAMEAKLSVLNISSPPITAAEFAQTFFGFSFHNHTDKGPLFYDMKSVHADLWPSSSDSYLYDWQQAESDVKKYIQKSNHETSDL